MPVFSYKAADASNKIIKGTLEAADERGAAGRLQDMGYIPIKIDAAGAGRKTLNMNISDGLASVFSRVSNKDVMLFTQDLSALLEAGLPVDRALTILIDVTENRKFQEIIREILKAVQGGVYLSDAMGRFPKAFSEFYVSMIRAGEAGGVLEAVLERLGIFLESSQDLKDFIKSALVYPIFLVFVGGVSIIILLTYVIPKFSIIFSDMGQAIPWSTMVLLKSSEILKSYWWVILGSLITGVWLLIQYSKTPGGRLKIDRLKMRAPVAGELIKKIEVARFTRTLGTLIRSGVPILQALDLVKGIIGNKVIAGAMERINERVKSGERLSKPMGDNRLFPSLAVQMITVGEESGRLDEMLLRVADNYEKVIKNLVKRFISFLEPAMILLMGLVVGFIVISMLMAVFSMNDLPF